MKKILELRLDDIVFIITEIGSISEYYVVSIDKRKIKLQRTEHDKCEAEFRNDHNISNLDEFGTVLKCREYRRDKLIIADKVKAYKVAAERQAFHIEQAISTLQEDVEKRTKVLKGMFEKYIETKSESHE